MAKALHTMVRVLDLDRSIAFYQTAFGLNVADRFDFEDFALVYLRNEEADFEVELTLNKGRTEPDRGTGILPGRRVDGAVLLRAGPGRLQDRGAGAARPLSVRALGALFRRIRCPAPFQRAGIAVFGRAPAERQVDDGVDQCCMSGFDEAVFVTGDMEIEISGKP